MKVKTQMDSTTIWANLIVVGKKGYFLENEKQNEQEMYTIITFIQYYMVYIFIITRVNYNFD
jgi:hypothetical protein